MHQMDPDVSHGVGDLDVLISRFITQNKCVSLLENSDGGGWFAHHWETMGHNCAFSRYSKKGTGMYRLFLKCFTN